MPRIIVVEIEHEPKKVKLFQASHNTREDLKITFRSSSTLKMAVDVIITNPAQHRGIDVTLNSVIERERNRNSMSILDIRKIDSSCSRKFYHHPVVENMKIKHHTDNLSAGFSLHPFVIDSTGNIGPRATKFIKFINEVSGVSAGDTIGGGRSKVFGKEVFLKRRILFICNLRSAIARENALLQLKPYRITPEIAEFC